MSFSPYYPDDPSQFQSLNDWNQSPQYPPTPGIGAFGQSPPPQSVCSPPPSQIRDEYRNPPPREPQSDLPEPIPFDHWGQKGIHYRIEWKVTLNTKPVTRVTEPNLTIAPREFWHDTLKGKVERIKRRKVFQNRRVRLECINIAASINDRLCDDVHQQSETINIDWSVIEEQVLSWSNLLRNGKGKGKKLRIDIHINYQAEDNVQTLARRVDKRGFTSVTNGMLAERDAQIDAEESSGQFSPWRDVYKTMRCSGSPCDNKDGYCWQDPVGKKHYKLRTHHLTRLVHLVQEGLIDLNTQDDVPEEIREQLYAEKQQWLERRRKTPKYSPSESPHQPININFLPTPSPQAPSPSMMASPAGSPPLLPTSGPNLADAIMIPDIPVDRAVTEYTEWQLSRVDTQLYKDNIKKAGDVALMNGLDLKQIAQDQNPEFFARQGVIIGVARRFVDQIGEWSDNYEPA